MESEETREPMPDIEDTDNLKLWIEDNAKRPPVGYDAMKHPDGKPFTQEEQIGAYIQQTLDVIEFRKSRGGLDKTTRAGIIRSIEGITKEDNTH